MRRHGARSGGGATLALGPHRLKGSQARGQSASRSTFLEPLPGETVMTPLYSRAWCGPEGVTVFGVRLACVAPTFPAWDAPVQGPGPQCSVHPGGGLHRPPVSAGSPSWLCCWPPAVLTGSVILLLV